MRLLLSRLARVVVVMAGCRIVGCALFWHENTGVLGFESSAASFRNQPFTARYQQHQKTKNRKRRKYMENRNRPVRLAIPDANQGETRMVSRRRTFIGTIVSVPILLPVSIGQPLSIIEPMAVAAEAESVNKKPFAPLENLLPAVRVKRSIDVAIGLTKSLVVGFSKGEEEPVTITRATSENTLKQLENLLLIPTNYVQSGLSLQGVPSKPADLYLKDYRSIKGDLPFQKMVVQSGDVDAWKRLKRREKKLEKTDSIRQALNAYTDALSFSGDSYLLTVDPKTKSSMVREDRLPNIKQVITSDMGMRYLYRNQVLTAMDEVKAELEYQLGQSSSSFDGNELLELLAQASDAMDRWLSLVPSEDVEEALRAIAAEEPYNNMS